MQYSITDRAGRRARRRGWDVHRRRRRAARGRARRDRADRRRPRPGAARSADRGDRGGAARAPHRLCADDRHPRAARGDRGAACRAAPASPCTADNVVVVPGAQGGLYCALQCLAGAGRRGDRARADLRDLRGGDRGQRRDDGDRAAACPSAASTPISTRSPPRSPRGRGSIWINSPHNPTGAVFTAEEIEAIAELCRRHDLWLVSDEVYEDLAFARPHVSPWSLPGMAGAHGRRLQPVEIARGARVPLRLDRSARRRCSRHLFNLLLCMTYGSPGFIQDGALAALRARAARGRARCARTTARARRCCRALLRRGAATAGSCRPKAACSCCSTCRGTGLRPQRVRASACSNSEHVAVLPCDGFGPSAAGHLRIALSAPDPRLEEAGERIVRFAQRLAQRP